MRDSGSQGISFVGLLAIVFIVLKLTGNIAWPWIWVLSPLWGSFVVLLVLLVLFWLAISVRL